MDAKGDDMFGAKSDGGENWRNGGRTREMRENHRDEEEPERLREENWRDEKRENGRERDFLTVLRDA